MSYLHDIGLAWLFLANIDIVFIISLMLINLY